jgi:hypothetical protein
MNIVATHPRHPRRRETDPLQANSFGALLIAGSTATPANDALAEQAKPGTSIVEFRAERVAAIPMGRFAESTESPTAPAFRASARRIPVADCVAELSCGARR